ncbi:hypothetical protein QMK19_33730 [Streptomyces sp. H10-C2]|uniref:hypothetical protein n=1 Tax=unclassified Streptomyces TaxID=2593676 RepID=UPI0024BADCA4|nr:MULTISPECIES: hypothetical protein [unclassified Streptomyces]MDJ0345189.1 hypothetical protein [Streptomyces sp. PH10-H1]MDJ0374454.1 hypothetical protein [Streptomyces sp. H10-C2]
MSIRRAAAALGAVSLGLVALTACEKPTPLATVTVGTKTVTTEATAKCYAKGKKLPSAIFIACLGATPEHTLKIKPGEKVRVGVDPSIGDKGWLIASGVSQKTDVLKGETYWTISESAGLFTAHDPQTGSSIPLKNATLNIVGSPDATAENAFGVWQFKLEKAA